jgi:hypothetical protein
MRDWEDVKARLRGVAGVLGRLADLAEEGEKAAA